MAHSESMRKSALAPCLQWEVFPVLIEFATQKYLVDYDAAHSPTVDAAHKLANA